MASPVEKIFNKKDIESARLGADVFYTIAAEEAVDEFSQGMTLEELINTYCTDPHFAEQQVDEYLLSLPSHSEAVMRAFVFYALLKSTRNALAAMIGTEISILKEAARGTEPGIFVDDDAIRDSAGYSSDADVADSSKTDAALEKGITDADVGNSASEDVIYRDRTASVSPLWTFISETGRLARGIIAHCECENDISLLVEAGVADEAPAIIARQIIDLTNRLEPPRDEDK